MNLLLDRTVKTWRSLPLASKMTSFALIGLGNSVIDFAVFTFAYKFLELPLVPSNVLAWMVAVSISYILNTWITFRAESGRIFSLKNYLSFAASGILGVFVTTSTLVGLSHFMPVLIAKIISTLAGFIVNFAMAHFVVFRTKLPLDPRQ